MDIKKLAAEKKAKALAELREAEAMEQDAAQIERMAAKHGWQINISPADPDYVQTPAAKEEEPVAGAKSHAASAESPPKKSPPGKVADPNSTTSRSKAESINVIRQLGRPVPLSELNERIKLLGVVIGGKNPTQALSANLGRCPELVATKRGWWLKGEKMPPKEKSPTVGRDELFTGMN